MAGPRDAIVWGPAHTSAELDAAQARFGFLFPPDLRAMLLKHRLAHGPDWVSAGADVFRMLEWPYEGLLFDVENNDLWWPEWGPRPDDAEARASVLRGVVDAAPRLIPVYGHRYMPATPHAAGNPVFSVYQADVIVYGATLEDYLRAEFGLDADVSEPSPPKTIPFWSELVERQGLSTRP